MLKLEQGLCFKKEKYKMTTILHVHIQCRKLIRMLVCMLYIICMVHTMSVSVVVWCGMAWLVKGCLTEGMSELFEVKLQCAISRVTQY